MLVADAWRANRRLRVRRDGRGLVVAAGRRMTVAGSDDAGAAMHPGRSRAELAEARDRDVTQALRRDAEPPVERTIAESWTWLDRVVA